MRNFILISFCLFFVVPVTAQQKEISKKVSATAKDKTFPKITTTLGNALSNTVAIVMMQQLLDSSLHARDQHNHAYQVIAFDFGFKKSGTFTDEKTGQEKPVEDYTGFSFRADKLDTLWNKRLKTEMRAGDELFFDRILVQNPQGEKYLSAPLHFIIKK